MDLWKLEICFLVRSPHKGVCPRVSPDGPGVRDDVVVVVSDLLLLSRLHPLHPIVGLLLCLPELLGGNLPPVVELVTPLSHIVGVAKVGVGAWHGGQGQHLLVVVLPLLGCCRWKVVTVGRELSTRVLTLHALVGTAHPTHRRLHVHLRHLRRLVLGAALNIFVSPCEQSIRQLRI